jgi:hypothetical protein
MARWGVFLATAMVVAAAVPNNASADQKKPPPKSAKGNDYPTESAGLNYGKVEWTYTQQKRANGQKPLVPNPARQGSIVQKGTLSGSNGVIKSPLPTTAGQHR